MLLTPQQIEELREIIREATTAVAVSTTGMAATPEQLARLVDQGYIRQEDIRDITLDAFELGRLLEKLPGADQMGYREFKDYLRHNPVEMSDAERLAYGIARDRAGQFCVGLGTRASGEVGNEVVQLDEQLASAWRNGIQDESAWKAARRDAVTNLTTRLRQMSEDWARDWGRIASTESQMAYQQGFLEATVRRHGSEELLAKMPEPNACDDCKRLYLDADGRPEAHPASWWAENGVNNVGRKRADWLPVLGAMHPWCQCQLVRVPRGMVFDADGDLVPESMAEKSLRKGRLVRQQQTYTCGPAALRAVLKILGQGDEPERRLAEELQTTAADGTSPGALVTAGQRRGLAVVSQEFTSAADLRGMVDRGPVIVAFQAWPDDSHTDLGRSWEEGHWAVVTRVEGDRVHFEDPATTQPSSLDLAEFERRWHDLDGSRTYQHLAIGFQAQQVSKGKAATPGEIHHWTTGPHQKQADGDWEPLDDGRRHQARVEELKGTVRLGGEYQIEGGHGLVMGDPSEPGKVRLQKFDARGFWGHQTYDNLDALIEDVALRHPSLKPSPGALDRLSVTPEWAEGTASAQVIQAVNTLGYHRHEEATEKVNRYWTAHGAIKTAAALEGANLTEGKLPPAFDAQPKQLGLFERATTRVIEKEQEPVTRTHPPVKIPEKVKSALDRGGWLVINSSGGKDSQAMTYALATHPELQRHRDRIVVLHADLGRGEWPGSAQHAEKIARETGLRFETARRDVRMNPETSKREPWEGDMLTHFEDRAAWPSTMGRFCTSDMKTGPLWKWMRQNLGDKGVPVVSALGIRKEEGEHDKSSGKSRWFSEELGQSDQMGREGGKDREAWEWNPLLDWKVEDVWAAIKTSGVDRHYAYDLGMSRLSCVFCVLASKPDLLAAAKANPERLEQWLSTEARMRQEHERRRDQLGGAIVQAQTRGTLKDTPKGLVLIGEGKNKALLRAGGKRAGDDLVVPKRYLRPFLEFREGWTLENLKREALAKGFTDLEQWVMDHDRDLRRYARMAGRVEELRARAVAEGDPDRRGAFWTERLRLTEDLARLGKALVGAHPFPARRGIAEAMAKSRKLHYRTVFAGLPVSVENRRGSVRHWYDRATDTEGTTKLKHPYGYIRMTEGADGDHLDVFLGPDEQAKLVYIVHQRRPPEFREFDEDKVMLGWPDLAAAKRAYLAHYDDPRFWGSATTIPIEKFRENCLAGKYRRGEMIKAQQLYLGPRGGRWADPLHTQSYQEGQPRPQLHERFGPSGAPSPGERGYRDPPTRPPGAWDGEEPDALAMDMITAARKVWEDVDYGMIAKLGDSPGGEDWQGFTYSDLPDLLHVPYKDGQGEPYTDEQRLDIAERLVDIAGETYAHAAQGEVGIELPPQKQRRGELADWNPERFREGMAIPTWVAAAILADSMDREHRDLRLVNVAKDEAAKFIAEHHTSLPYLNPRGLMYAIGVKRGGRLVAVATAGHPTGRALRGLDPRNIVELTRVASDGTTRNAASMLTARLLDLLEHSRRGDPGKPALFITYQLAGEKGDTYRALKDKGLRPVEYLRGDRPHGARAGSGPESLAVVDKIRWEAGPAAAPADWSLLEESAQLPLVKAEQGSFRGFGAPGGGWMPIQHPRGGKRGYYKVEGGKRVYHYPDFPSGRQVGQAGEQVASTVEVFVNVSAGAEHKRLVRQDLGDFEWLRSRLGKLEQRGVGVQVTAQDVLHIRKTPGSLENWQNTFVTAARDRGLRMMVDSGEAGRKRADGPPIDFDQVVGAYELMADRMPPGTLQVVAPDVIGDPETTAALRERYADRLRALIGRGVDVIVPIQARDSRTIVQDYLRVRRLFGDQGVIIAFPTAINTLPMRAILPAMISIYRQGWEPKVHFLGLGDPKATADRTAQIVSAHYFARRVPLARVWELVKTPEAAQAALGKVKAWNELAQLTVDPRFDERVRRWAHKRGLLTEDQAAAPMWGVVEADRPLGEAHDQAWQAFLEAHPEEFDPTIISLSHHWRRQAQRLVQGDSKTISSVQQYGKRHDPVTGTQVPATREVSTAYPKVEHFPEILDEYLVSREMQTEGRVAGKDEPWGAMEKLRPLAKAADATIVQISHRTPIGTMGNWGKPARTAGANAYAPGMPPDHPASIERRKKRKKRKRTPWPEEKQARMRALTSRYQDWARPFPRMDPYEGDRRTEEHRAIFDLKIEEKAKRLDAGRLTINPKALRP